MKKLITLFAALFLLGLNCLAQTNSSWLWGTEASPIPQSAGEGLAMAEDQSGNTYLTGYFSDTLELGRFKLFSNNGDAFLIKYDTSGNVLWAKQSQENSYSAGAVGWSVVADGDGNTYLTGFFQDSIFFGSIQLQEATSYAMFLVKYDMNGNVIWAKQSNSSSIYSYCSGLSVTLDKSGNIYVTGTCPDTIKFDAITLDSDSLNGFTVKYDRNGNVVWAKPISGSYANSIASDKYNNIYITGKFLDTLTIGSITLFAPLNFYGIPDIFIAKYDSMGNVLWAEQSYSDTFGYFLPGQIPYITADNYDNIYLTGSFYDTISLGKIKLTAANYNNIFLIKLNSSGNTIWGKSSKSAVNSAWTSWGITADNNNHIYLAGADINRINDTIQFGSYTLTIHNSNTDGTSLVLEFDTSGNALCGSIIAAGGDDNNAIAVDSSGKHIYFGGDLATSIRFGPDSLTFSDSEIPFMARWNPCDSISGINTVQSIGAAVKLYPNPNDGNFIITMPNAVNYTQLQLYNILGQKIFTSNLNEGENRINISTAAPGIYIYKIIGTQSKQLGCGKVVIE